MKRKIVILTIFIFYGFQLFSQYDRPLNNIALEDYLSVNASYPFSFVVIGDTRDDENSPNIDADFIQLMNQIAPLNPKFVINVGDVVISGTEQQYQAYYQYINDWMLNNSIAFFTVPGNHEFWTIDSYDTFYPQYIGEKNFSFDLENIRIIAINNVQHEDDPYPHVKSLFISEEQLTFVENKLSEQNSPPLKFGFTHVPLINNNYVQNQTYIDYYNLLVNYDAKANFCGHVHKYKRYYVCNGIFDIVTGGGGASTGGATNPPIEHPTHHFLLVTVSEDNNVKVETYFINEGNSTDAQQYDFTMPTSQDMILQNQIILSGEERIFASQNTIEVAGGGTDFIVENGSNVEMVASESITLKPGFHAKAGSNFHAYIQDLECENIANKSVNATKSLGIKNTTSNEDIVINRQTSICIFPNPSENGIFTLYFYGYKQTVEYIEIFNVTGTVIYKKTSDKYIDNIIIDISGQNAGVYLMKIKINNKIITKKIIIN